MQGRITLGLTLHNHQPVGNFGWVIAEVYEKAYLPMLDAIEGHPLIRLGLHYSGPLLEWLRAERPEFLVRLRVLVARGQVEILGGGLYEPVLASLPERDRIAQLTRMADAVEGSLGVRPAGAWLAERVWEPDLPTSLVDAGYAWTILDDAHFRAAGIAEDAMWGPYTTEDQGRLVTVFGTEKGLRYRIPFREVEEVIDYLHSEATEAGDRLGVMGDDGEKFGAWPGTWEHCWGERRWVERFFEALEANADWLATTRPSDWLAGHAPVGRTYLPTGSYDEMGEWALPAAEGVAFAAALHHAREAGAPEARWLRGASWRNFQVKYREINDLHKQMLRTSAKVDALPNGAERDTALDQLHLGQSNDCYWHGLFGGIYIAHMRAATHEHLIAAEDIADRVLGTLNAAEVLDLDLDGRDEVRLATPGQVVTIDLDEGAGIGAWDLRAARHSATSVLRRRPEAYHEVLRERGDAADGDDVGAASPHEAIRSKERGLAARLVYDGYERRSGLVRFLPADATPETWAAGGGPDLGDLVAGPFRLEELSAGRAIVAAEGLVEGTQAIQVRRTISLDGGRMDPQLRVELAVTNGSDRPLRARLGLEWATTMLGGGGNPSAWWEIDGQRAGHDGSGAAEGIERLAQGNDWLGVRIDTRISPACDAWWAPIETVSNSEDGFERVYQGSALLTSWVVDLEPGQEWLGSVEHLVATERDGGAKLVAPKTP
ncbi:MAG TPA: alpha-amylase/4-alpha-glucanotransferase domain-containing protein [Candidatus Limnocylindrales bacterium]|nr:alpha-amylase/4-alpha-glucanotransferase domain-containing protein [Candidatus Limnocylindrales bacterium]